jgi:hypothetical protein
MIADSAPAEVPSAMYHLVMLHSTYDNNGKADDAANAGTRQPFTKTNPFCKNPRPSVSSVSSAFLLL